MSNKAQPKEAVFWNDGWSPNGVIHVPPEYVRLSPGDPFKTRRARKLSAERGVTFYTQMKKTRHFNRPIAYLLSPDILAAVEEEANATKEVREKARKAAAVARQRSHSRHISKVIDLIRAKYPKMPGQEARSVAEYSFEVGSGRVGRTAALVLEKKIDFAVWAHARHQHTDYDDLINEGWSKEDARKVVSAKVAAVVQGWRSEKVEQDQKKENANVGS